MVATNADDRKELNACTRTARARDGKAEGKTMPVGRADRRGRTDYPMMKQARMRMEGVMYFVRKMITFRSFVEKSFDGFMRFSYSRRPFPCLS